MKQWLTTVLSVLLAVVPLAVCGQVTVNGQDSSIYVNGQSQGSGSGSGSVTPNVDTLQIVTGRGNTTTNPVSIGTNNVSTGLYAFAQGNTVEASGRQSHAQGQNTVASGRNSHAEGNSSIASGMDAHAEGGGTEASGNDSHAEGASTRASKSYSHAEGASTAADGISSHAEGDGSTASGTASHAEGAGTYAIGTYAHAEGVNSRASGDASHAEGDTQATGTYAHAEGYLSRAYGYASHAAGLGGIASNDYSWVWSSHSPYYDHGPGTFNIGVGAQSGIWANDYQIYSNGYLYSRSVPVLTSMIYNASIIPTGSNTLDLGSAAFPWRHMYVSTGSIYFVGGVATQELTASDVASLNSLGSTNAGNAGWKQVGTTGGYMLDELYEDTALRGLARDYPTFSYSAAPISDLTVTWTTGDIYDPVHGYYHINADTAELTDNSVNYAYWNYDSDPRRIYFTTTRPNVDSNIIVAIFSTAFGMIMGYDSPEAAGDFPLNTRAGAASIAPSLIVNGMTYYATATNLNAIVMDAGVEYHDMRVRKEHSAQNLTNPAVTLGILTYAHTNVGLWGYALTNRFPVGLWDNNTNVTACDAAGWYKGLFLSMPGSTFMHYIYPQVAYTSETDAIEGADPAVPPGFTPYAPWCTEYVFKGDDVGLRVSSTYWVDRRFQIRRPGTTVITGGSALTPSLNQVMIQGSSLGGILPHDAGLPTDDDQLACKSYVDSTINNVNSGKAYVDKAGNDGTALVRSSILPFKTIQAAINAVAVVATDTSRYTVVVSPGVYTENITMKNYVSLQASDTEATVIEGTVTYPVAFDDLVGSELQLITVSASNAPAIVVNTGDDEAYAGIRACYLKSFYDNDVAHKSLVLIQRGMCEIYSTTYNELNVAPTNGSASVRHATVYEHTTDGSNPGLAQLFSYGSSCTANIQDENDAVMLTDTHDNSDVDCVNTIVGGVARIHLDTDGLDYSNQVMLVYNHQALGSVRCKDKSTFIWLTPTNNCNTIMCYNDNSVYPGSAAIAKDCSIDIFGGATSSNIFWGAATTTNDMIKALNSTFVNVLGTPPQIYTNDGSAGTYAISAPSADGDFILGGAINMTAKNTITDILPRPNTLTIYIDNTTGLEQLYYIDSKNNRINPGRDSVVVVRNDETNTLQVGELVYYTGGVLAGTSVPYVKRAKADSITTMPCIGCVIHTGGITSNATGLVQSMGVIESVIDTRAWTPGQLLYVSDAIAGSMTNVAPARSLYAQEIGKCLSSSVSGKVAILLFSVDTLGNLPPSTYITNGQNNMTIGTNMIAPSYGFLPLPTGNLVTNGTFDSWSGWQSSTSIYGGGAYTSYWVITDGYASNEVVAGYTAPTLTHTAFTGELYNTYRLVFEIKSVSMGTVMDSFEVRYAEQPVATYGLGTVVTAGWKTNDFTVTTQPPYTNLQFFLGVNDSGDWIAIDNVSITNITTDYTITRTKALQWDALIALCTTGGQRSVNFGTNLMIAGVPVLTRTSGLTNRQPNVTLGTNTVIGSNSMIMGRTILTNQAASSYRWDFLNPAIGGAYGTVVGGGQLTFLDGANTIDSRNGPITVRSTAGNIFQWVTSAGTSLGTLDYLGDMRHFLGSDIYMMSNNVIGFGPRTNQTLRFDYATSNLVLEVTNRFTGACFQVRGPVCMSTNPIGNVAGITPAANNAHALGSSQLFFGAAFITTNYTFWLNATNYVYEVTPDVGRKWIVSVSNGVVVTNIYLLR